MVIRNESLSTRSRRHRSRSARRLVPCCAALVVAAAWAQPSAHRDKAQKLDAAVTHVVEGPRGAPVRVIVRTREASRDRIRERVGHHGDRVGADYPSISAFAATVHGGDIDDIAADPDVESVSLDAAVSAHEWKINPMLATEMPRGAPSAGNVRIAIVDSGLEPNADLNNDRLIGFYDFTHGGVSVPAFDDYGHGTHVAGLIAGGGANSGGYYKGLAPGAKLLALKVLDRNGGGYTSSVIAAIEFIVANQQELGIDIINLSLGHPIFEPASSDPLVLAIERAASAGIIVVVSAGNFGTNPDTGMVGYGGITSPGNAPSAITVGCVDIQNTVGRGDDTVCPYSSRGPTWYDGFAKPDIVVAGHRLASVAALHGTLYRDYPELRVAAKDSITPRYFRLSGTSMATAVASGGIAALLDSVGGDRKYYTPNLVKALLQWTALPIPGADALTQGAGSVNFPGAIAFARRLDASAAPGEGWLKAAVTPSTTFGGTAWPWSQSILWGNFPATGTVMDMNQAPWLKTVVWGNTTVTWHGTVVWGNDVVWADAAKWNQTVVWGNSLIAMSKTVVWGNSSPKQTVVWGNLANIDMGAPSLVQP
jgi:serine protease AprX